MLILGSSNTGFVSGLFGKDPKERERACDALLRNVCTGSAISLLLHERDPGASVGIYFKNHTVISQYHHPNVISSTSSLQPSFSEIRDTLKMVFFSPSFGISWWCKFTFFCGSFGLGLQIELGKSRFCSEPGSSVLLLKIPGRRAQNIHRMFLPRGMQIHFVIQQGQLYSTYVYFCFLL